MVKKRSKFAKRLVTADTPRKAKKTRNQSLLGRTKNINPRPRKARATTERAPRTPRMRPKKSVGERLRPDEAANPRPFFRLRVLGVLAFGLFAIMLMRLWYLQVLNSNVASQAVTTNEVRNVPIAAPRGMIIDRAGNVLVGEGVVENITLSRSQSQADPGVIERLALLSGQTTTEVTGTLNNVIYSPYLPVPVVKNATPAEIAYVSEHPSLFPGVQVDQQSEETYPYGDLAAQVLGYVGPITQQELKLNKDKGYTSNSLYGQAGLENWYEQQLRGKAGSQKLQVNAQGTVVGSLGQTAATPGDDIVTNIDAGLQAAAEGALAKQILAVRKTNPLGRGNPPAPDGAAVVLDPQTGAVLAMANFPTYNPEWFVGGISTQHLDQLDAKSAHDPIYNRALEGVYPPGSTFKLATATAALNTGLITANTTETDPGSFTIPNCSGAFCTKTDNDNEAQPGPINVVQALTVSSDVFFYKLGYQFWIQPKYGLQPIENVAAQYGYGQPTGIDLYEQSLAEVDSPTLRQQQHKSDPKAFPYSNWTVDDNIELAFGQGETIITPLEQAVAYGTFAAHGTRYAPEVAAGILSASGKVVQTIEPKVMSHVNLPPNVYGPILTGLEDVISQPNGTGYLAFQGFPLSTFQLAGKTGTASVNNQQPDSWFVAFGPEPNPKYVVAAVVDQGGYGADAAAPVVRDIFNYLLVHPVGPLQLKLPSTTAGVKSPGT